MRIGTGNFRFDICFAASFFRYLKTSRVDTDLFIFYTEMHLHKCTVQLLNLIRSERNRNSQYNLRVSFHNSIIGSTFFFVAVQ